MKRTIIFLLAYLIMCSADAQTYYKMWRGNGNAGDPEWIANLSTSVNNGATGIGFTTANRTRSFVNYNGRWGFLGGSSTSLETFNNTINGIDNLTIGAMGWICANGFSVRSLASANTPSMDMKISDGHGRLLATNLNGLWLINQTSKKIVAFDTLRVMDPDGIKISYGRNSDPGIKFYRPKMLRLGSPGGIGFWDNTGFDTNDTPLISLYNSTLNLNGDFELRTNNNKKFSIGANSTGDHCWIGTGENTGLFLGTNSSSLFYIDPDHNVYVGMEYGETGNISQQTKAKYNMFVKKGILAEDYSLAPINSWADYVFSDDYKLMPLNTVKQFISEEKHLPDVPSAEHVAEHGYSQHDMNTILLKKIEELTLYIIQQQEEIDKLKQK